MGKNSILNSTNGTSCTSLPSKKEGRRRISLTVSDNGTVLVTEIDLHTEPKETRPPAAKQDQRGAEADDILYYPSHDIFEDTDRILKSTNESGSKDTSGTEVGFANEHEYPATPEDFIPTPILCPGCGEQLNQCRCPEERTVTTSEYIRYWEDLTIEKLIPDKLRCSKCGARFDGYKD